MTEPVKPADQTAPTAATPEAQPVEEWKPEPRQWTWKDLFTAPMLAFKPKCMLVMAVTAILIALWYKIAPTSQTFGDAPEWVIPTVGYLWTAIALVIFSLGATLVATFMKADLLDDEFLTFGEALAQWKGRLLSAILVPIFLTGLLGGFQLLLAGCELVGSIPFLGPILYAVLYPLGFLLGLLIVLLSIAVVLATFVFPAIVAIRKHGWFDNVVDTFEAVGTKPHVLVGSAIMTIILILICRSIAFGAMGQLRTTAEYMPGTSVLETEQVADRYRTKVFGWISPLARQIGEWETALAGASGAGPRRSYESVRFTYDTETNTPSEASSASGFHKVTGGITSGWKILFTVLIVGYLGNLFVGGGMLTYLAVREDDYWDDEDLEDLDKLAKELEDEAKAEADKAAGTAKPTEPVAAGEAAKPTEPPPSTPA